MQFSLPQKFTFISFLLPCFVAETTKRNLLDRSAGAWLKSKRNPRKADKCCVRLAFIHQQQSGAVEACWAHNPEVRGSKPRSANNFFFSKQNRYLIVLNFPHLIEQNYLGGNQLFSLLERVLNINGADSKYTNIQSKMDARKADKCCVRQAFTHQQQSGAVEACWAHNPEVRGSKPRSANNFFLQNNTDT